MLSGKYQQAEASFNKVLELAKQMNAPDTHFFVIYEMLADANEGIAEKSSEFNTDRVNKAYAYRMKGLESARKIQDLSARFYNTVQAQEKLAAFFLKIGKIEEATTATIEEMGTGFQSHNPELFNYTLESIITLGEINIKYGNKKAAEQLYKIAIAKAKDFKSITTIKTSESGINALVQAINQSKNGPPYFKSFYKIVQDYSDLLKAQNRGAEAQALLDKYR